MLTFEPVFYQRKKQLEYQLDEEVQMLGDPDQVGQLIKALFRQRGEILPSQRETVVRLEAAGRKRAKALGEQPGRTHTGREKRSPDLPAFLQRRQRQKQLQRLRPGTGYRRGDGWKTQSKD